MSMAMEARQGVDSILAPEPEPEPEQPEPEPESLQHAALSYLQSVHLEPSLAPPWTSSVPWARCRCTLLQAAQRRLAWAEALLPVAPPRALDCLVADMVEMVGGHVIGLLFPQTEPCTRSLIAAAKASDETELQLLLAVSADVNGVERGQQHRGASGGTALLSACLHNHRRVVEILLEHGAEVDKSDEVGGWSPLLVAAGSGYADICRVLLSAGADWRRKTHAGETALDWARLRGKVETAVVIENWARAERAAPPISAAYGAAAARASSTTGR